MVYNPNTNRYVLWINWLSSRRDFGSSKYLVATADSPAGPFVVQNSDVKLLHAVGGDFDIFVDSYGSGYIIYTSLAINHAISIEKLAPSYLSSTLTSSGVISGNSGCFEAPAMFKRGDLYYALYGTCCCFCTPGTLLPLQPHDLLLDDRDRDKPTGN